MTLAELVIIFVIIAITTGNLSILSSRHKIDDPLPLPDERYVIVEWSHTKGE